MKVKNDGEIKFKVSLDGDEAKNSLSKLGNIGKQSFKAISAGVVATGTALTGLISKSVQMAGELEQQMGGTEAVFKEFASEVQKESKKVILYHINGFFRRDFRNRLFLFYNSKLYKYT